MGRVDAREQARDRHAGPRLRGVPARRAVQRRPHGRRARREQVVERQVPRPARVDDGQPPVASPHVRHRVVQPAGDGRRRGVDGMRPGEPPLRAGQAGEPDGALQPGVQRTPTGGEQRGPHQGPPAEVGGARADRPHDDVPRQQGQEQQGERDVHPQRLDPGDRAEQARGRADPGGQRPERQRGEPDGRPSTRAPAAHPGGDDPALARHERDHDKPDDAVPDRDPRAALRSRRLCGRAADEGERQDAQQGEVGRPPRPRPGRPPGNGAHPISHQCSQRAGQ